MSLHNRVAATVGIIVLTALAIASAVLFSVLRGSLSDDRDHALTAAVTDTPAVVKGLVHDATGPVTLGSTTIQVISQAKASGAGASFVPISPRDLQVLSGRTAPYFADVTVDGKRWRVYTARAVGDPNILIRAAVPAANLDSTLSELLALLAAITLAGAGLSGVTARLIAGRVLRPVARLTRTVEHITATRDLSVPIHATGRDEIARLARSFASMMAAVDESVASRRQLVADASHELRTPLTSLTTNLDLLAEDTGTYRDQTPALVREARHQVAELTALVNDLIELARHGSVVTHTEDVRLDLVAEHLVARARTRAPRLRFDTHLEPVLASADPDAIERAISNLVDNAIKFSPDGGQVLVRVSADGCICVTDRGPGISAEDIPHVFDRFYRAPTARAMPGSGLGLAIVQQVAHTHGGSVSAESLNPGAKLTMRLPITTM